MVDEDIILKAMNERKVLTFDYSGEDEVGYHIS